MAPLCAFGSRVVALHLDAEAAISFKLSDSHGRWRTDLETFTAATGQERTYISLADMYSLRLGEKCGDSQYFGAESAFSQAVNPKAARSRQNAMKADDSDGESKRVEVWANLHLRP